MSPLKILTTFVIWGVSACVGMADMIRLSSTVRFDIKDGDVRVEASLANDGDTIAENVVVTAQGPFGEAFTNRLGHIDPGDAVPWGVSLHHPRRDREGRFIAQVHVRYEDANGYPLDAVFIYPYSMGAKSAGATLALALEGETELERDDGSGLPRRERPVNLTDAMELRLTLMPLTDRQPTANLKFVLPDGLGLASEPPMMERLPRDTQIYNLIVTNRNALAGSLQTLYAVVETDDKGVRNAYSTALTLPIGGTVPQPTPARLPVAPRWAVVVAAVWVAVELLLLRRCGGSRRKIGWWLDVAVLAAVAWVLAAQLPWRHLFTDTLTIGGDTPAHHYMASHLRERIFSGGGVVSWAPGWWSGFPLFQFYFPLPYIVMAVLGKFIAPNIAFKLVTVAGFLALPFACYIGGRILRLARPVPALLALAVVPLLLDTNQRIWGVNLYSTLAGMISNSWSFALLPVALASALRDVLDARPRIATVLLLALVVMSHFFTAIVAAILLGILFVWLCVRAVGARTHESWQRTLALVPVGLMTFLLMAWWLIPLVATRQWSVDYGGPWDIDFLGTLPHLLVYVAPPALVCIGASLCRRMRMPRQWMLLVGLHILMLVASLILFKWGAAISPVFVNCRLWPFIVYAVLTLAALAAGGLIAKTRVPELGVLACVLAVFAFAWDSPNYAPQWAAYNYKGVEALPEGAVLGKIAAALKRTPGRVAYDLHEGNTQLGSSRIFETLPYLCGKPIVEGGVVNSALGSIAAYSVQGDISDSTAGLPVVAVPHAFDPGVGLRRLELMGVKHFIARSRKVQAALEADPAWELMEDFGKWRLYENPGADGAVVRSWNEDLEVRRSVDPQGDIVQWLGEVGAVDKPRILLLEGQSAPVVAESTEDSVVVAGDDGNGVPPEPGFLERVSKPVQVLAQSAGRLRFRTEAAGRPHLIAISYFPNWKVRGASQVYLATPGYMVVYPEEADVELRFGRTRADMIGNVLTALGLVWLIAWWRSGRASAEE